MATFSVTNTNDSGSGSLRQAILDANALSGKDIINFDGVFADNVTDIITLSSNSLNITDDLSINGTGADLLSIKATLSGSNTNVFEINSGVTVDIGELSIANSSASNGINNSGTITLNNIAIRNNSISNAVILNTKGVVTVDNSIISNNGAARGQSTVAYNIYNSGTVIVSNSTISNNLAILSNSTSGSNILTISNTTISDNNFTGISTITIGNNCTFTINNSNISNNTSFNDRQGFFYNIIGISKTSTATISNTTINDNKAKNVINNNGVLTVNNSTISDNGLNTTPSKELNLILNNGTLAINNSTIIRTFNNSNPTVDVVGISNSGTATVKNTIIASNLLTDGNDVRGNFISNGYNIIGNLGDSTGFNKSEQLKVDITDLLDLTLRDNGGTVKTHALVAGSLATNAGLNADVPADVTDIDIDGDTTEQVPFDGRGTGFARISGGTVDIGAFEAVVNVINGTQGRDTINGTAGDDIITGFKGKDLLTGGDGANTFIYTDIRDAGDTITDFEVGKDKIILRQLFESLNLANLNFITATSGGYLGFETQGTSTVVLVDPDGTSGQGRAVKFLTVDNVTVNDLNNAINFGFFRLPSTTPSIFTVTNTNDSGSGSLRQAILDANASLGKDIIKFDGIFADKIPDTITLTSGSLAITDDLSIEGTSADLLTISGNNTNRAFEIRIGVPVDIEGLTVANGKSTNSPGGGGIFNQGFLTLSNSIISNNSTPSGSGGGIYNTGTVTVNNSTINSNSVSQNGIGIDLLRNTGIFTVNNSTISGNTASSCIVNSGSGIFTVNNSTISGNTASSYFISNFGGGIFTVNNSTISGNTGYSSIYNTDTGIFTVNNSTISGNKADGISNSGKGTATVTNSTISGNTQRGIYNYGTLTVSNSTISDNTQGGIYNNATLIVSNSTISGNRAAGIYNYLGRLTVSNSTISGNTVTYAGGGAGGIYNSGSASFTLKNSIVAGNFDNASTSATDFNPDVLGNFISNGYNLIGNLNGSTGFNASEQLNVMIAELIDTTLQNNGGSVLTYALVAGSPAINAGLNADVPVDVADLDGDGDTTVPVPFDERGVGFARIVGDRVDIGAFEAAVSLAA